MHHKRFILPALLALSPLPAFAQANAQDDASTIVVRGSRAERSDWREAETQHVILLSNGSEADTIRIAHNLERLHFLLSLLLNRLDQPDETKKLRITLIGDTAEFDAMELRNLRWQQGPYARTFTIERYYDPREDGAVMATTRFDQVVNLQPPVNVANLGVMQFEASSTGRTGMQQSSIFGLSTPSFDTTVNANTIPIPAESRIYAGFAQHFLLTYFPAAYPRWYLDGFGELFSTIKSREDGVLEYGRVPEGFGRILDWYGRYPVRDVLNGHYLEEKPAATRWTPFHAWALTHFLFFSEARRPQLRQYLAALASGAPPAKAAEVFGDLDAFQRELKEYEKHRLPYEEMTYPRERAAEPAVRRLTKGQAAFLKGRLELGSRVEIAPPPPAGLDPATASRVEAERRRAIASRDRWLAALRRDTGRYASDLEAQLLLAEAECRSGNPAECLAAAERAEALAPKDSRALAWKGIALARQAAAAAPDERKSRLKAARAAIAAANRADTEASLPLIAYYRSFTDVGDAAPDVAIQGLAKVVETVPASPTPRVMLGAELARTGDSDAARRALRPVSDGPYQSPEQPQARAIMERLGSR